MSQTPFEFIPDSGDVLNNPDTSRRIKHALCLSDLLCDEISFPKEGDFCEIDPYLGDFLAPFGVPG